MSGELWAEISAREEEKTKTLQQKYKQKMVDNKVRPTPRAVCCLAHANGLTTPPNVLSDLMVHGYRIAMSNSVHCSDSG